VPAGPSGLSAWRCAAASLKELVGAGDELLYRAKDNGKDRIEQAERSGSHELVGS
jgi:PleD family two-component response regulator